MKRIILLALVIFLSCQDKMEKATDNRNEPQNGAADGANSSSNDAPDEDIPPKTPDESIEEEENKAAPGESIDDPEKGIKTKEKPKILKGAPINPGSKESLKDTPMETPAKPKENAGSGGQSAQNGGASSETGNKKNNLPVSPGIQESGIKSGSKLPGTHEGNKGGSQGATASTTDKANNEPANDLPPGTPPAKNEGNTSSNNNSDQNPRPGKTNTGTSSNAGTPSRNYGGNKGVLSDTADEAPGSPSGRPGTKTNTGQMPGNYTGQKGALGDTAAESPRSNPRNAGRGKSTFSQGNYSVDKGGLKDTAQEAPKPLPIPPPVQSGRITSQTTATRSGVVNAEAPAINKPVKRTQQTLSNEAAPVAVPAASKKINPPVKIMQRKIP